MLHDINETSSEGLEANELISKLKQPLWLNRKVDQTAVLIAITVNPPPTKLMNKKPYFKYSLAEQQRMLNRIESKIRKDNPLIVLEKIYYEICPVLKQMHFHAMYRMPMMFLSTIEAYYARIMFDKTATKVWRYLDTEIVYNPAGWLKYIQKDDKLDLPIKKP